MASNYFCQVNALLSSLDIDTDTRVRGSLPGRFQELEEYWNDSQGRQPGPHAADGWVTEFDHHRPQRGDPNAWAHSFEQLHGANGWASEFEQVSTTFRMLSHLVSVVLFTCYLCSNLYFGALKFQNWSTFYFVNGNLLLHA